MRNSTCITQRSGKHDHKSIRKERGKASNFCRPRGSHPPTLPNHVCRDAETLGGRTIDPRLSLSVSLSFCLSVCLSLDSAHILHTAALLKPFQSTQTGGEGRDEPSDKRIFSLREAESKMMGAHLVTARLDLLNPRKDLASTEILQRAWSTSSP